MTGCAHHNSPSDIQEALLSASLLFVYTDWEILSEFMLLLLQWRCHCVYFSSIKSTYYFCLCAGRETSFKHCSWSCNHSVWWVSLWVLHWCLWCASHFLSHITGGHCHWRWAWWDHHFEVFLRRMPLKPWWTCWDPFVSQVYWPECGAFLWATTLIPMPRSVNILLLLGSVYTRQICSGAEYWGI